MTVLQEKIKGLLANTAVSRIRLHGGLWLVWEPFGGKVGGKKGLAHRLVLARVDSHPSGTEIKVVVDCLSVVLGGVEVSIGPLGKVRGKAGAGEWGYRALQWQVEGLPMGESVG